MAIPYLKGIMQLTLLQSAMFTVFLDQATYLIVINVSRQSHDMKL